jgi:pimeloyl-ACP methyl ester carboxylesterase
MNKPIQIKSSEKLIRGALSVVFFPLTIAQKLLTKREATKYQPLGTLVDTGTSQIHVQVSGEGKPTIILDAGMGGFSVDWAFVQPELSKDSTILSYDRAGYGWSQTNEERFTSEEYVEDLRTLLAKLKLEPPYILVGHSFGGLNMRLFAANYPEEIAGLVLVDSVHEHFYLPKHMSEKRRASFNKMLKVYRIGYILSPLGIPRFLKMNIGSKRLPQEYVQRAKAMGYKSSTYKTVYMELMKAPESAKQVQEAKPIPDDIPITVISAGKQTEEWKAQQTMLCNLNNNTKQIIANESWHSIQIHEPTVVIDAIREMASTVEKGQEIKSEDTNRKSTI